MSQKNKKNIFDILARPGVLIFICICISLIYKIVLYYF